MMSQNKLGAAFANGDKSGESSHVKIIEGREGRTHLLGYGWAIYATREPDGRIVFHEGWRGYSTSTSCQLSKLRQGVIGVIGEAPAWINDRPERGM